MKQVRTIGRGLGRKRRITDKPTKDFLGDISAILVITLFTIAGFWYYNVPGILLGGGLGIAAFVAADAVLLRRSDSSPGH